MSFVTDDEKVYEKYDEIWNVVKGVYLEECDFINDGYNKND